MPISSILVGVALALLVVPFVAGPLLNPNNRRRQFQPKENVAPPEAAKQQALAALRDLDFDFRTSKISEDDYTPLRQQLLTQAAEADRAVGAGPAGHEDEIEAAVRALRGAKGSGAGRICPECHTPTRVSDKFCPKCGAALGLTCPACHTAVQASDQFCAHCGKTLKAEAIPAL